MMTATRIALTCAVLSCAATTASAETSKGALVLSRVEVTCVRASAGCTDVFLPVDSMTLRPKHGPVIAKCTPQDEGAADTSPIEPGPYSDDATALPAVPPIIISGHAPGGGRSLTGSLPSAEPLVTPDPTPPGRAVPPIIISGHPRGISPPAILLGPRSHVGYYTLSAPVRAFVHDRLSSALLATRYLAVVLETCTIAHPADGRPALVSRTMLLPYDANAEREQMLLVSHTRRL